MQRPLLTCPLLHPHAQARRGSDRSVPPAMPPPPPHLLPPPPLMCPGEAVIGQFPLLRPDGADFVYQSCTRQQGQRGSMEGSFK